MLAPEPRLVDWKTLALIAAMAVGFPLIVWLHADGLLPFGVGLILATILMNASFTAWHEPAHGNFSSSERANQIAGVIASYASVYPGYFARRREHLIHHRWEGIPGKDPVYPRIQANFWRFPLRLIQTALKENPGEVPTSFLPVTPHQRFWDLLTFASTGGVVLASILMGFWVSVLGLWILPRVFVYLLHAYVICFFPHTVPGGGYEVYRIRPGGFWLRALTMGQNFHGIHHRWPFIPWHRYGEVLRDNRSEVEAAGIRMVSGNPAPGSPVLEEERGR